MKKLFTLFVAAILAVGAYAQETPSIQVVAAQESQTTPGVVTIGWQADSTLSKVYLVYIYSADLTTQTLTPIVYLPGQARAFAASGHPGMFVINSSLMFKYGASYPVLKDNPELQVPKETLDKFKAGWENNVDATDSTLVAGDYYVAVTGYDATLSTVTEKMKGYLLNVVGKTQGVENVFESKKPVKYMTPDGQVRIFRDGKIFNMSGALVQ